MTTTPRTLMLFVDGLGLGSPDPAVNPLHRGACPCLADLLRSSKPIDACLGVPGVPQSATGQTTLLTGCNAARHVGRHVEGFPGSELRDLIRGRNLFAQLARRGYVAAFANAYYLDAPSRERLRRHPSVTSVAALDGLGGFRGEREMLRQEAVCQDLTRECLRERGYDGPLVTPEESACHLVTLAKRHDLTLFEYFQTDRVAHRGHPTDTQRVLTRLEALVKGLLCFTEQRDGLFLLTSDHGNLEDETTRVHTTHPVPLVALGHGARRLLNRVESLVDVLPALLELYPPRHPGGAGQEGERL